MRVLIVPHSGFRIRLRLDAEPDLIADEGQAAAHAEAGTPKAAAGVGRARFPETASGPQAIRVISSVIGRVTPRIVSSPSIAVTVHLS